MKQMAMIRRLRGRSFRSIRVRLAAWYLLILGFSLGLFAGGMWFALQYSLIADVDADLAGHFSGFHQWLQNQLPGGLQQTPPPELLEAKVLEYASGLTTGYGLRVSDAAGRVLFASPGFPDAPPAKRQREFRSFRVQGQRWRTIQRALPVGQDTYQVEYAASLGFIEEILEMFSSILWSLVPAILVLALGGGYWMSRRALRPVDAMTQTARSISLHNLSQRLAVPQTGDELQRLAETLNQMMGRLESSVRRMTQFTADASHELRTPITMMQTAAELALRRPRSAEEYRQALAQILEDIARASQLIEDLLLLARADAGTSAFAKAPVEAAELVEEACRQMLPAAGEKQIALRWEAPAEPGASVMADRGALGRLLLALIDNALKYTPAGGRVEIGTEVQGAEIIVGVSDSGPGIAPGDLPHIFDRFYRADKARTSENGGFGLGLSIAQEIAAGHGGHIEVESQAERGSRFRVRLPALDESARKGVGLIDERGK